MQLKDDFIYTGYSLRLFTLPKPSAEDFLFIQYILFQEEVFYFIF